MQRELTRFVPKARELVRARAAARSRAAELYPEVLKANSPEARAAEAILAATPGLKLNPEWPLLVGRMLAGERAEKGETSPASPARERAGAEREPARERAGAERTPLPPAAPGARPSPTPRVPARDAAPTFDAKKVRESGYAENVVVDQYAAALG